MNNKGLEAKSIMNETPNVINDADKPLNSTDSENIKNKRVDINVLKARAKAIQDKENFKNYIIVIFFLFTLGVIGVYFSI